jgi:DNA polymerase III delta subunit
MAIVRTFSAPETKQNRLLFEQIDRLMENTGKSFSQITVEALSLFVDKNTRLVQQRLEDIRDPIYDRVDEIRAEYVKLGNRFATWEECLKANDLFKNIEVLRYSIEKGFFSGNEGKKILPLIERENPR